MQNFKYPTKKKLKKRTEISELFSKGKWKTYGNLRIITLKNSSHYSIERNKFGVSVSKKYFKKAVCRNRLKRLLRECYRLNKELYKESFGEKSISMIFWISKNMPSKFQEVEAEFKALCNAQKK